MNKNLNKSKKNNKIFMKIKVVKKFKKKLLSLNKSISFIKNNQALIIKTYKI